VLPKVDDMGRREGRLVELMVGRVRSVSSFRRSRKILIDGQNISKAKREK
jgi:hypothetical protein